MLRWWTERPEDSAEYVLATGSLVLFYFILFWKEVVGYKLVRNDDQRPKPLGKL